MRWSRERGAMMPLIAGATILLAVLAFGGITLGRLVVARQEMQRAADAVVLAAGISIRQHGLPFDDNRKAEAEALARRNTGQQLTFDWAAPVETADKVDIACTVTAKLAAPAFIWKSGGIDISASATSAVPQQTLTEGERKYPKLALVLDFSGSMLYDLNGVIRAKNDPTNSYNVLLRAVNLLLTQPHRDNIKYGLVIFETTLIAAATTQINLNNAPDVQQKANTNYPCPNRQNCTTATWLGLDAARTLFEAADNDEAEYAVLVSDGAPGDGNTANPQGVSQAAAARLWNRGVTIFTVYVNNGGGTAPANFMRSISGPPDDRGNPNWFIDARSEQALKTFFTALAGSLACQVPIPPPQPPANKKLHVFVKVGGDELLIEDARLAGAIKAENMWNDTDYPVLYSGNYFFYDPAKQVVNLSPNVCPLVLDNHDPLVIRYTSPQLTE